MILAFLCLVLTVVWMAGAFAFRHIIDRVPAGKMRAVLVGWAVLFLLMPLPQLWWKNYVAETPLTYWQALAGNWLFYSWVGAGWLWSVLAKRKRGSRLPPPHGS